MIRFRQSNRVLSWGLGFLGLIVIGPFVVRWLTPLPPLLPALNMVAAGQYDDAEPLLRAYLSRDPGSIEARIGIGEILLNRSGPDREARATAILSLLDQVRGFSPAQFATISTLRGQALEMLHRLGSAESAYSAALRADPTTGEAGWLLLQIFYVEGRREEARRLALRLFRVEPDMRDRVRLLVELCRPDARPLASGGIVAQLEPAYRAEPANLPTALTYLLSLTGEGQEGDTAIAKIRSVVAEHPDSLLGWDILLTALGRIGQQEGIASVLAKIPASFADEPRIVRHRGELALDQGRYGEAITALSATVAAFPWDVKSMHRLGDALKFAGRTTEAEEVQRREADAETARLLLRGSKVTQGNAPGDGLFDQALSRPDLGLVPDPALYAQFAAIRERMGHRDEALAWHRLVLEANPDDAASRAAVARLEPTAPPPP